MLLNVIDRARLQAAENYRDSGFLPARIFDRAGRRAVIKYRAVQLRDAILVYPGGANT